MSYFVTVPHLKRWLDKAQLALVLKNKVRKDLWTDFGDIVLFDEDRDTIPLSSSEFTTLQSFLQTEGRSDSITNDVFLNWVTTLHDLRKKLAREVQSRAQSRTSSLRIEESDEKHVNTTPPTTTGVGILPETPIVHPEQS